METGGRGGEERREGGEGKGRGRGGEGGGEEKEGMQDTHCYNEGCSH